MTRHYKTYQKEKKITYEDIYALRMNALKKWFRAVFERNNILKECFQEKRL